MPYLDIIQWSFDETDTILYIEFPPKQRIDKAGLNYAWTIELEVLEEAYFTTNNN